MKNALFFTFFLFCAITNVSAQYCTNPNLVWAFGAHAGLNFSTGSPVAITTPVSVLEGCAAVSNSSGGVLFYTDAKSVWDRTGTLMPHGASIVSYSTTYDAAQGAQIIPIIGTSRYLLFSGDNYSTGHRAYCMVDTALHSGLGDVVDTVEGISIGSNFAENMTAVAGNNCDVWLLLHRRDSAVFWAYNITASGLNPIPVVSTAGTFPHYYAGVMKCSPNRQWVVVQDCEGYNGTELYNFDPSTGTVSNAQVLNTTIANYGAEFSSDNTKLYTGSLGGGGIYQYDISLSPTSAIVASKISVGTVSTGGDLKLAADGKIYIVKNGVASLDCITSPNGAGGACGYTSNAVTLASGTHGELGLPNIVIAVAPNDTVYARNDTVICISSLVGTTIRAHDTSMGLGTCRVPTYLWDDGVTTTPTRVISATGMYWVRVYNGCGMMIDSINVTSPSAAGPVSGAGGLCAGATAMYTDTSTGGAWSSTSTTVGTIDPTTGLFTSLSTGVTTIVYTSAGGCLNSMSVTINPIPPVPGGVDSVCVGLTTALTDLMTGGTWTASGSHVSIGSSTGVASGLSQGTSVVTYTMPTSCASHVTITANPDPASITGTLNVCAGSTTVLSDATAGGVWTSSNSFVALVGTTFGSISGISAGIAVITYTLPTGCAVTANVTVNPLPGGITGSAVVCLGQTTTLVDGGGTWSSGGGVSIGSSSGIVTGLTVGPGTVTYTLPTGCKTSVTMTVAPLPSVIAGPTHVCTAATISLADSISGGVWSSSSTSTAYVDGSGIVTGITGGVVTITYTSGAGCFKTDPVTVNSSPAAIGGVPVVCVGATTPLVDAGGTWSSSADTIGSIGVTSGIVTGIVAGYTIITYVLPTGCYATQPVTVNPLPLSIAGNATICVGLSSTLIDLTGGGSWSSDNIIVAPVDPVAGTVLGATVGTADIIYTLPTGCATSKTVTINSSPGLISGTLSLCVGAGTTLSDPATSGTWTSDAPTTATIASSTGFVHGVASGIAHITYALGAGCTATATVTVNPLPSLIGGPGTVCAGATIILTDGGGGTWSAIGGATVNSASGLVTGVTAGPATITYTLSTGCSAARTETVNASPAAITGSSNVCVAGTRVLSGPTGGAWSSSNTAIATVGTTGVVSGVAAGPVTISYTLPNGCYVTKAMTVSAQPAIYTVSGGGSYCAGGIGLHVLLGGSVLGTDYQLYNGATPGAIIPGTGSGLDFGREIAAGVYTITATTAAGCAHVMTGGATITVNPLPVAISGPTAVCTGATALETDASGGGAWSMGTGGHFTIGTTSGIVTGISVGSGSITYTLPTGCLITGTMNVTGGPSEITGAATLCAGATTDLADSVSGGLWTSSSPATAAIGSLSGIVSGITVGTIAITYSLGSGCTTTRTMTVLPSPAAIGGTFSLCAGTTASLSDGTAGGAWSVAPLATGTISTSGVFAGLTAGVATVSYTAAGCAATQAVTVNAAPGPIGGPAAVCVGATIAETDSITGGVWSATPRALIDPATGIITGVSSGTATISYAIGSCAAGRSITVNRTPTISGPTGICLGSTSPLIASVTGGAWTTSSGGTASVNPTTGIVTGLSVGTAIVTYTPPTGCAATAVVTVNTAPGAINGNLHVCTGQTTTLTDSTGGGIWSAASGISINSTSGLVTGITPGTSLVTYSLGSGCVRTATVTVNVSPAAISGTASVCAGANTTLTDGTAGGSWTVSAGASVTSGGVVTGITAGMDTVSYTVSGCIATDVVTVNALPATITAPASICAGLEAAATDATPGGTWSASPPATAIIDGTGTISGIVAGVAEVTYTLSTGCRATTSVNINSAPEAITGSSSLCIGSAITVSDPTGGGSWSAGAGVTVGSTGSPTTAVVTGITTGITIVSYTAGGCTITKTLTVNTLPPAIAGPATACVGATTLLTDAGGGTWTSSNPVIATIDSTGTVTGRSAGPATITYSLGVGCTVTRPITVNNLPSAILGTLHMCVGATTTLSDLAGSGSWGESGACAVISSGGVVTGISGGTASVSFTSAATGCSATAVVTVMAVPPIQGMHDICAWGDTLEVSDSATTGLYASTLVTIANEGLGAGIATSHAPGTATITYILPSGCLTTASMTVKVLPDVITASAMNLCTAASTALGDATTGGTWSMTTGGVITLGTATGAVTGIAAGSVRVTYTAPNGCSTDTIITVSEAPLAVTLSGPAQVCAGAQITLLASTGGGNWSVSTGVGAGIDATSGTVTGIAPGTDSVTYSRTNRCGTTAEGVAITVNPTPQISQITGKDSMCVGNVVLLRDSVSGGVWTTTNGTATTDGTGLITGVSAGMDTVIYTTSNAWCSASASMPVKVIGLDHCIALEVNNPVRETQPVLNIYPNPTQGDLMVISNEQGQMTLIDLEGRQLGHYAIAEGKNLVSLPGDITNGIYILEFQHSNGSRDIIRLVLSR